MVEPDSKRPLIEKSSIADRKLGFWDSLYVGIIHFPPMDHVVPHAPIVRFRIKHTYVRTVLARTTKYCTVKCVGRGIFLWVRHAAHPKRTSLNAAN